ncbi:unnamed protein product [Psylliodes chrysocephalus]|uniref:Uncharacterized protein n=1 Tax=Psylliodes chrysocephalus TaxID=3402493 RepID=A0A9P0CRC8_9CUCU|nr:unnamed protein product [Psylliodes chrysocephala]
MRSQIVLLVVGLVVVCVESRPNAESKIVNYDSDVREDGYSFSFETSDPIKRNEQGKVVPGPEQPQGRSATGGEQESNSILQVNGDFGFDFPEGIPFYVTFVADENGYRPKVSFGTKAGPGGH